jgi:hypothetical protein
MVTASALQLHPDCTVVLDEEAASRLRRNGEIEKLADRKLTRPRLPIESWYSGAQPA